MVYNSGSMDNRSAVGLACVCVSSWCWCVHEPKNWRVALVSRFFWLIFFDVSSLTHDSCLLYAYHTHKRRFHGRGVAGATTPSNTRRRNEQTHYPLDEFLSRLVSTAGRGGKCLVRRGEGYASLRNYRRDFCTPRAYHRFPTALSYSLQYST